MHGANNVVSNLPDSFIALICLLMAADPPVASELLWRVNPDEFNRRFRNKVMVDLVADKLGSDAGTVLAAMLSHGRRYETAVKVSGLCLHIHRLLLSLHSIAMRSVSAQIPAVQ